MLAKKYTTCAWISYAESASTLHAGLMKPAAAMAARCVCGPAATLDNAHMTSFGCALRGGTRTGVNMSKSGAHSPTWCSQAGYRTSEWCS